MKSPGNTSYPEYSELLKSISSVSHINLFYFDADNNLVSCEGRCRDISFLPDVNKMKNFQKQYTRKSDAYIYVDAQFFLYGILTLDTGGAVVCGPACADNNYNRVKSKFYEVYHRSMNDVGMSFFNSVGLANFLVVLEAAFNGKFYNAKDILAGSSYMPDFEIEEEMEIYRAWISDENVSRYGIEKEEEFNRLIEEGREKELLELLKEGHLGQLEMIGDFATSEFKKIEYMFVASLIMARMAAVRGGMKYEMATDISDVYLKRVEQCRTVSDIYRLIPEMHKQYVHLVHMIKMQNEQNVYVEFCKNEISRNITKPFNRDIVAKKLGISPGYLSMVFSKETGMSLTEYRMKARLSAACNMLRYSDVSIAQISERFQFSSASRFSQAFQNEYGIKPSVYRKRNKIF